MSASTDRVRRWKFSVCAAFALALSGFAGPAQADLVINGGFEADDTTLGPVSPPAGWTVVDNAGADGSLPNSGSNDGFLGNGTLSQSIATVTGQTYEISFFVAPDVTAFIDPTASFQATFGGVSLVPDGALVGSFSFPGQYVEFTDDVLASTDSALLSFAGQSSFSGTFYIDDVSVQPVAVTSVPEPAALSLLILGVVGFVAMIRLRRRRSIGC